MTAGPTPGRTGGGSGGLFEVDDHVRPEPRKTRDGKSGGVVVAAFPDAAEAGAKMLRECGNAIDAACAAAWALGVCEPAESGLGDRRRCSFAWLMGGAWCWMVIPTPQRG